jgi:hypothetical protein
LKTYQFIIIRTFSLVNDIINALAPPTGSTNFIGSRKTFSRRHKKKFEIKTTKVLIEKGLRIKILENNKIN